ncbi:YceI-like domain-containing protein [Hymenobacter daecheongensis DSM 21074]|uniref:YceI-like domain-containing protein n=1 Tax=Hymenobacter daecheongensis DSM 21074 TaxID=1121955 RepID=A0A1M6CY22_9BACT|nr:YceI family protein [Hymenobacter daecheongensis]SHI65975.1 YceI-like domain-containing protein [Hymenobacter daecheongensis DSM 21074]
MKYMLIFALSLLLLPPGRAQSKYSTRAGLITFFSSAPLEDIEARNTQVAAVLDLSTGQMAFTVPMKAFQFRRSLMQEHFNENYVESDKYPQATFTGRVLNFQPGLGQPAGPQAVQVEGDLTIHGVKRRITTTGTLEVKNNQLLVQSKFVVAPADYNIRIPALVRENIAKSVAVTVALTCGPVGPLQAVKSK